MRKPYPSDLNDAQWEIIQPLIPVNRVGRPRTVNMREVLNTIFYQAKSGCQWDMLPHDLLPKSTVHDYFSQWRDDGTWQTITDALRQQVRGAADRQPSPRVAYIDSQTVKATEIAEDRGYDGGKKITGRKRHILVDSLGLLLVVLVTVANADDGTTAPEVLARLTAEHTRRLEVIWGDTKYHNHALVLQPQEFDLPVFLLPGLRMGLPGHLVPPDVVLHQNRRPSQPQLRLVQSGRQQPHRSVQRQLRDFFFKRRCPSVTNRCASPTSVM
jgi:transposase